MASKRGAYKRIGDPWHAQCSNTGVKRGTTRPAHMLRHASANVTPSGEYLAERQSAQPIKETSSDLDPRLRASSPPAVNDGCRAKAFGNSSRRSHNTTTAVRAMLRNLPCYKPWSP